MTPNTRFVIFTTALIGCGMLLFPIPFPAALVPIPIISSVLGSIGLGWLNWIQTGKF